MLADPRTLVAERAAEVDDLRDRARRSLRPRARPGRRRPRPPAARVRALSPLATLERGYAVLQDAAGHVVTSVAGVEAGAAVSIRVADGRVHATTTGTEHDRTEESPRVAMATEEIPYEQAREELVEVVRRLEAGGTHARGVAGAVGARREARDASARTGSTAPASGSTKALATERRLATSGSVVSDPARSCSTADRWPTP